MANDSGTPVSILQGGYRLVVNSDGSINVSAAAGGATAANQVLQTADLDAILAKLSADPATQTTLAAVLAALGATNGAAVITDANGTIQQYLRGIVKLAITAGGWLVTATLAAGSAIIGKVGIDQTTPGTTNAVSVPAIAVTATVTSVDDLGTSTQLLASTATRKGYKLYNDSTQVAYVKEGTTASTSDYSYQIQPLGYYESVGLGCYTGRIDAIWASNASGAMKITELT